MNRLWVRLSLYFGTLILIGVVLMLAVAHALVNERINQLFLPAQLSADGGVVETLRDYYRTHGSWQDVGDFMRGVRAAAPLWSDRLDLTLADGEGHPLYHLRRGKGPAEPPANNEQPSLRVPIDVDGRAVGELEVRARPAALRNPNVLGL